MSILGRRGSRESGWSWPRLPPRPVRPPPPPPPYGPIVGAGLILFFIGLALLALWLSDGDGNSPAGGDTATPEPTATAPPSPPPTPAPTTPPPSSILTLAAWDGDAWRFGPSLADPSFREGEAVPFLLRIDRARPGDAFSPTIRFDCGAFSRLTGFDRDRGSEPALAPVGPGGAVPDAVLSGAFSLWGGSFSGLAGIDPTAPCAGEAAPTVELTALAGTVYLMWGAEVAPGAAGGAPLRLAVRSPGSAELSLQIEAAAAGPP